MRVGLELRRKLFLRGRNLKGEVNRDLEMILVVDGIWVKIENDS